MTAVQPAAALDIGFQLSLAATAGLIVFGPWVRYGLERGIARARLDSVVPGVATQVAALSLSATIATLPVIWVNFGQVSLTGPLANIVIEPVFVVAFALSAVTAVAGIAWEPAGWALGLAAYYPLAFTTWFARTLAEAPFVAVSVPRFGGEAALAGYAALAAAGWPAYRRLAPSRPAPNRAGRSFRLRRFSLAIGGGAIALAVVPVSLLPARGPGALEVTALDIGQGDAILVTTPHGHQLLVDGGPSGIDLARELGAVLPHWDRSLDAVLVTHPQEDHIGGVPAVLRRFDVGTEYDTGVENAIEVYPVYRERAGERRVVREGDSWTMDGVRFEVIWPPEGFNDPGLNDTSIVLRVTYGSTRVLLTGDFEAPAQHMLMASEDVAADVLKVPHHGSKTSAPDFLAAVHASVALISVGAGNSYGHPHLQTLDALAGSTILRTDLQGRITVRSDGRSLRVRTRR
jgi:competence protein ComEC